MTAPALSFPTPNGRYYSRPGGSVAVPSITNIKDMLDKPGLKFWAAREAASYAAANREKLAGMTEDEVFRLVRGAPFARTDDSPSAIGDIVHRWIENYIKTGSDPSPEEIARSPASAVSTYGGFTKFREHYKPEFTDAEFTVWSDRHGYAGTADASLIIGGRHALIDTKTGKDVYPDVAIQLAAIAHADVVLSSDGRERPVPSYDAYGVLHLRPGSTRTGTCELKPIPPEKIEVAWAVFLALKVAFDWKIEHADSTIGFAPRIT